MENLKINGLEYLSEEEKIILDKIVKENYEKIKLKMKNNPSLILYIKEYNTEGKRKKYSLLLEIKSSAPFFKAETSDWDFARTLHKLFNKVFGEIEHRFHVSEQH